MSVFGDMQLSLAVPAQMELSGDPVIRTRRDGVVVNTSPDGSVLMGIFVDFSINDGGTGALQFDHAHRDMTAGERAIRIGQLQVAANVPVARGDRWTIKGEDWQLDPNEWLGSVNGGLLTLILRREEKVHTREASRHIL
jgi:hypothetical protein